MADVTTTGSRVRETNLRVQIRSVEVDLATVLVDDVARLLDAVLKHTVGRWIRNLGNKMRPGGNVARGR
jgi:hypothetical protein